MTDVADEAVDPTVDPTVEGTPVDPNAVAITINGRAVTARKGDLVINAAERAGEYIPRFCYHPRMEAVGMCRQCLVEIDTGRGPALQPSCMISVAPDMVVDTESATTKRAQEGILELLLANHPLDCPVCDKGGECPLQDQAFSHGPAESRYVEEKRHYEKPIAISDHVLLDRERCILCDRCTRFADEVAGDKLIHFINRGNFTEVATFPDEPFASYFSGNVSQVCPVGALTAKPYRFKARPWDLSESESTCTTCAVGCRVSVQSSRDELLRVQGVDTGADSASVNWGWLCDRGRFNFQATASDERLLHPLVRTTDGVSETSWNAALALAAKSIRAADTVAVLGGARSTNEGALAWARLADAIGATFRDAQLGDGLSAGVLGLPLASLDDAAAATTIIVLGPDVKEELPVLYLRLRDAARKQARLIEITPRPTGLNAVAWRSVRSVPGNSATAASELLADAEVAAQLASGSVVVVVGRGNLAGTDESELAALQAVLLAVPDAKVLPAFRRGNVVGALTAGLAPTDAEHDARAALQAGADSKLDVLVLVGADPLADFPDTDLARRGLAGARQVIAVDSLVNATNSAATIVLPAAMFGEQAGTTTNLEGRVTAVSQQVTVAGTARPDWMIASELAAELGYSIGIASLADATRALGANVAAFAGLTAEAASSPDGFMMVPVSAPLPTAQSFAQAPNSYDYRLIVSRTMYDTATVTQQSPSLAPLAKRASVHIHPLDLERVGVADGSEVQLLTERATVVLPLTADSSVARGTLWAPFNQVGKQIGELVDANSMVTDVRIERL